MDQNFAVLGLHEISQQVTTQNPDGSSVTASKQVPAARVRIFIGDKAIDEDFVMPRAITVEEQIADAVKARTDELLQGVKGADSNIILEDGNQVVNTSFHLPEEGVTATEGEAHV